MFFKNFRDREYAKKHLPFVGNHGFSHIIKGFEICEDEVSKKNMYNNMLNRYVSVIIRRNNEEDKLYVIAVYKLMMKYFYKIKPCINNLLENGFTFEKLEEVIREISYVNPLMDSKLHVYFSLHLKRDYSIEKNSATNYKIDKTAISEIVKNKIESLMDIDNFKFSGVYPREFEYKVIKDYIDVILVEVLNSTVCGFNYDRALNNYLIDKASQVRYLLDIPLSSTNTESYKDKPIHLVMNDIYDCLTNNNKHNELYRIAIYKLMLKMNLDMLEHYKELLNKGFSLDELDSDIASMKLDNMNKNLYGEILELILSYIKY